MADKARLQFLIQVSLLEAELTDLFSQMAQAIVATVARETLMHGQQDAAFSRSDLPALMPKLHAVIRQAFLGTDSRGRQTPFEIRGSQVQPLSPYASILWRYILKVSSMAVQRHEAIIAHALKDEPALHAAYKPIWNKKVSHIVREQEELRPRIFSGYEPAHTWVDPNGYRLSDRIWRTEEEVRRRLDLYMADAIAQGKSSVTIARELEQFLQPGQQLPVTRKPYGRNVSYNTMRLARTEIAAAANWADYEAALNNPFIAQYIPSLSNAHEVTDICDQIVDAGPYEMDDRSGVPPFHPHCLCTLLYIMKKDVDEVIEDIKAEVAREFPARLIDGRLDIEGVQLPTVTMRSPWGKQAPLFPPPLLGPVPPLLPLVPGATPSPTLPPMPESALAPSEPAIPEPAPPSVTALQGSGGVNQIEVDGKLTDFSVFGSAGDAQKELLKQAADALEAYWPEGINRDIAQAAIANARRGQNIVFLIDDTSMQLRGVISFNLKYSPVLNKKYLTITAIASQPGTRGVGTRLMEMALKEAYIQSSTLSVLLPEGHVSSISFFQRFAFERLHDPQVMSISLFDLTKLAKRLPDTTQRLLSWVDTKSDLGKALRSTANELIRQNAIPKTELDALVDASHINIFDALDEALLNSDALTLDEAAIQLKQNVARGLADVLRNDDVFQASVQELFELTGTVDLGIYGGVKFRYSVTGDIFEEVAARLVRKWADTSGDADPLSIAIQIAANKEFGLNSAISYPVEFQNLAFQKWGKFIDNGAFGRFLRAQYRLTQEYFMERGIKELWLWRGMEDVPVSVFGVKSIDDLPEMVYGMMAANPLSSWSADFNTALQFGGGIIDRTGYADPSLTNLLMGVRVSVEDVLAIPLTGAGCATEYEAILLGRPRSYWISTAPVSLRIGSRISLQEFLEYVMGRTML